MSKTRRWDTWNADDDARRTGSQVLERSKTKKPSMWHVVMLNDDYTPMDFVVALIQKVFHHPVEKATEIMLEVHRKGKGICGTYTLEVAEMKATQCIDVARRSEYPLLVGVERAPS